MTKSTIENRVVEITGFNTNEPWETCKMSIKPRPKAPFGHVVIRVLCRSVNPSDIGSIKGIYHHWKPKNLPASIGFEGMGIIDEVGEGVTSLEVGQRVYPFSGNVYETGQGLWQDYIVVPHASVVPIPPSIPDDVAAQFYVNPWTVVGLLNVLQIPKGDYLLQTAANSILGRMLIQYAHHLGIKTINIVRRGEHVSELKALGADEVINSSKEDVFERVYEVTGGKLAHSAIDCIGGKATSMASICTRNKGRVIVFGDLGGDSHIEVFEKDLIIREILVQGFWLSRWVQSLSKNEYIRVTNEVFNILEKEIATPLIGQKFQLQDFKEAIKKSMEPGRRGKVLLVSY